MEQHAETTATADEASDCMPFQIPLSPFSGTESERLKSDDVESDASDQAKAKPPIVGLATLFGGLADEDDSDDDSYSQPSDSEDEQPHKPPRIGADHQVSWIPPLLAPEERARRERPEVGELMWDPMRLQDAEVDEFLQAIEPVLSRNLARQPHDVDLQACLYLLHTRNYDVDGTIAHLKSTPFVSMHPSEQWSQVEIALFEAGRRAEIYGKRFRRIQRLVQTKTLAEVMDFYYTWKCSPRYKIWLAKIRLQEMAGPKEELRTQMVRDGFAPDYVDQPRRQRRQTTRYGSEAGFEQAFKRQRLDGVDLEYEQDAQVYRESGYIPQYYDVRIDLPAAPSTPPPPSTFAGSDSAVLVSSSAPSLFSSSSSLSSSAAAAVGSTTFLPPVAGIASSSLSFSSSAAAGGRQQPQQHQAVRLVESVELEPRLPTLVGSNTSPPHQLDSSDLPSRGLKFGGAADDDELFSSTKPLGAAAAVGGGIDGTQTLVV